MASPSASDAVRYAAARGRFAGWTLVDVSGRHRERFLASQLTSDVLGLAVGSSQLAALLDASGRLQSFFFLHKLDDAIRLLVPDEVLEHTLETLRRSVIADDVSLEARPTGDMCLVLGPAAVQLAPELGADRVFPVEAYGARGFVCWGAPEPELQPFSDDELEARRVLSGLPRWGVEASRGDLVNATALVGSAVSFSKGCYLGQETVAKLASHRGAPYAPVLLRLADGLELELEEIVGQDFAVAGRARAGRILSSARWDGSSYVQASLWRELRVDGLDLSCSLADGREIEGSVVPLPLLRPPAPAESAEDLYLRASSLFSADREEEAITLLECALAVCPTFADAYETLGVIFGRHGRFDEAIELMQRLLEVDPESVMAHTNMSVYHNQLGRIEEAEREARLAAEKRSLRTRREQAGVDAAARRREQAAADRARREEMFRQVLAIDPDDTLANFGLGQLKVECGEPGEAVPLLERAVAADADHSAAYLALGRALEGLGERDRARAAYRDGVRVAARRGDLKTANTMQERLAALSAATPISR